MTLAGHEFAWGPGAEPPEIQGFWAINYCQMSMHFIPYLVTLVGRELAWGPGGGAPGSSGVLGNKYCQMSMLLYLSCDTGRSRIGVGSRGGAPGSSGVLGNK